MAAESGTEPSGLSLIDMPPEIVQRIAFDSGVLSPADVGSMKKSCHPLRDLLGGGNETGDQVALRKHGQLLSPQARGRQKNGIQLLIEGDEAGAIFRWKVLRESPTRKRNQPLRTACKYGRLDAVKYLLTRKGVDPGARNIGDWYKNSRYANAPVVYAAIGGHTEVVRELYASGRLRLTHPQDLIQYLASVVAQRPYADLPWTVDFEQSVDARVVAVALAGLYLRDAPPEVSEQLVDWLRWELSRMKSPDPPGARRDKAGRFDGYVHRMGVRTLHSSRKRVLRAAKKVELSEDELAGLCWFYSLFDR